MIAQTEDAVREVLARLDYAAQTDAERRPLSAPDAAPEFEPGPEDYAELDDWLERLEVERNLGINARFV